MYKSKIGIMDNVLLNARRIIEGLRMMFYYKMALIGFFIVCAVTIIAIAAPLIALRRYDETNVADRLKPPSSEYPFGTDDLGRCIFSRVIYGSRIALMVGLIVMLIEASIGVVLGLIAGYYGGIADKVISAITDIIWALPPLVLALGIVIIIGPGLLNVVAAIAIVSWPPFTRITRAKVQSLVNREFILAARAIGENNFNIIVRYILPNVLSPIIVLATLTIPSAILSTTALSFLGFGAQPPTPDWGAMLAEGRDKMIYAPWITTFPGIFIVITALGFNLLGDGLRDMLDPKLKI